jgi:carbon-monoxide dehydrogenase medium subunit
MKPAAFDYHAPETAGQAVALLTELGEDTKPIAGGQSLVPMLNLRLAFFAHLVDLRRIAELRGIRREDGALWIGAGTTQAAVERSAEVHTSVPLLARATPLIGHFQIRNRGTIGGSLAHADAAAEYPAVAITLDAEFEALSVRGPRTIPAAEFFTGVWSTDLEADELLTGVRFPMWAGRCGFAVEEFARRHGDFAIAGATVAVELDDADRVVRCAIGLFGLGSTALRATEAEVAMTGQLISEVDRAEPGQLAMSSVTSAPTDLHGDGEYRKQVGAAMVSRAWQRAVREAAGD